MARLTITRCDRCKAECPSSPLTVTVLPTPKFLGGQRDLCERCAAAFVRFMKNEDQVGEWVFESRDDCRHHVPCAGPCDEKWVQVRRA